jgi:hypothetical protein
MYHTTLKIWLFKIANTEVTKTNNYEKASYYSFDINLWKKVKKENFVLGKYYH